MRLFVAIDLSEEMRASLVTMMHDLKKADVKGSYQPVANLHLTLAFLGETEDVETVKEVLKSVTYKPSERRGISAIPSGSASKAIRA